MWAACLRASSSHPENQGEIELLECQKEPGGLPPRPPFGRREPCQPTRRSLAARLDSEISISDRDEANQALSAAQPRLRKACRHTADVLGSWGFPDWVQARAL